MALTSPSIKLLICYKEWQLCACYSYACTVNLLNASTVKRLNLAAFILIFSVIALNSLLSKDANRL